jgi:hypothetical protein
MLEFYNKKPPAWLRQPEVFCKKKKDNQAGVSLKTRTTSPFLKFFSL